MDGDEAEFLAALDKIQCAADANKLAVLGFAVTLEILEKRIKLGWRALICHADVSGIYNSGVQGLQANQQLAMQFVGASLDDGKKLMVNGRNAPH